MSDEEEAPAGVAAEAGDAEAAAGDAAPAGSHSLLDHLFLRVTQNKDKVILGFANATCDVIAANYLTSGKYPTDDNVRIFPY